MKPLIIFIILLFRLGTFVTVPGLDKARIESEAEMGKITGGLNVPGIL